MSDTTYSSVLKKILEATGISSQLEKSSAVKKLREEVDEIKENLSEVLPLKELQETIRKNSGGISKSAPKGATVNTSLPIGKTKSEKQSETNNLTKSLGIKYAGLGTNGGLGISWTYDKTAVDNSSGTSTDVGAKIKSSLSEALKPKYGDIGIKGIFEKIGDRDVVKYLNQARDSIKRNVKNGILTEEKLADYPNMENGLAMFYAADEQGDKKAAKMAYEAAYTKGDKIASAYKEEEVPEEEFISFFEDHQKRQAEKNQDIYDISDVSEINKILLSARIRSDDEIEEMKKIVDMYKKTETYYDFTSDGSGLDVGADPTPLEAAELTKYIYDVMAPGKELSDEKFETDINGWSWSGIYEQNHEGLDIGVFEKQVNGKTTYVVVNAGSATKLKTEEERKEFGSDWSNNLQQPFGYSQDMKDSIEFAKEFVEDHPDANIIFVGYSKGGAEAAANAVATGKKAILFNPASVNLGAYDLNSDDYDGDMTAYVVDGEILNNIFGDISTPIDKLEIINKESLLEKVFKTGSPIGNIYGLIDGLKNHSIESVIDDLQNQGEE